VFASRWLGMGPVTERFEQELAAFLGVEHVVAVGHGTSALHLALDALGLGPGDEVLVPALTFVATIQAIRMTGATPVFCEVDPATLNLDLCDAVGRATRRTRVLLPVHFAGLPCDMEAVMDVARQHGWQVVADAAHAFGASWRGRRLGSHGDLTCFSFDAIKHITCGDGGAIATVDGGLAARLRQRRRLGIETEMAAAPGEQASWQYRVVAHGFRYHLPDLHAAIGLAQLPKFAAFCRRRAEIVARYDGCEGLVLLPHDLAEACPWAYVLKVLHGRRDALRAHLLARGINTLIQFIPNHLQPAFAPWRTSLPVTEQLFREIVSLPLFVELTDAEVTAVIEAVRSFVAVPTLTPA
jgi:perosamine synthetase